jgi:hypothetical protein
LACAAGQETPEDGFRDMQNLPLQDGDDLSDAVSGMGRLQAIRNPALEQEV